MFNLSDRSKMAAEGGGGQKQPENISESGRRLKDSGSNWETCARTPYVELCFRAGWSKDV